MKKIVLVLAVLLVSVSACKNPFLKKMLVEEEKGESSAVPKHTVTFSVEGGTGGALKAKVDGNEITTGDSVEQGKSVVFTAKPAPDYVVEQWTNGGTVIGEAGTNKTYTHTVTADADIKVKFKSLQAVLTLSPDKLTIGVTAVTSDGSAVAVEGCTETELTSGIYTVLHAKGTKVILKGSITKLSCGYNWLTALNVQGLTALQELWCYYNQLTELNAQGCTALKELWCGSNQLTELKVQGCTALQTLACYDNQLTELNMQGLTALQGLACYSNQLNADAFKKLFDDLPQWADSDDAKCCLYTEETGVSEGNHTDFTAPPDLAAAFNNAKNNKKWRMYKWNISGPWVEI